jgi:hypothetical protein
MIEAGWQDWRGWGEHRDWHHNAPWRGGLGDRGGWKGGAGGKGGHTGKGWCKAKGPHVGPFGPARPVDEPRVFDALERGSDVPPRGPMHDPNSPFDDM